MADLADEETLLAMPDFDPHTIASLPQTWRYIVCMHLDIFHRRVEKFQRRAILSIRRLVKHSVLSEDACDEHLQLLVGKVDTETLPPSFGECEVSPEQFWVVQVSFRVEALSIFVPVGMAVKQGRGHTNDRAGGYDGLLSVGVAEDEIVIRSHAILTMGCARVQTERFFYESVEEWQGAELHWIGEFARVRHHSLKLFSKSIEDHDIVEDVERQR